MTRSLRALLRHILTEPAFLYSDTRIRATGFPELSAQLFFVRFEQITSEHVDQDRGYWGTVISYGWSQGRPQASSSRQSRGNDPSLPDAKPTITTSPDADLWLNAGPPREPSVLIRLTQVRDFVDFHHLVSLDDVIGCHLLVLGRCARSSRGKAYIRPSSPAHLAFLG